MDINIKYDISEVAKEIADEVKITVSNEYRSMLRDIHTHVKQLMDEQAASLAEALSIKDTRQRERVKKALSRGLDKWVSGVLKNG